jgi:AbrB family looped-hinge helix DNA binding protein
MDDILVKVCEGGRVVIPAEYREAMGIEIGDELVLHMERGKNRVVHPQASDSIRTGGTGELR